MRLRVAINVCAHSALSTCRRRTTVRCSGVASPLRVVDPAPCAVEQLVFIDHCAMQSYVHAAWHNPLTNDLFANVAPNVPVALRQDSAQHSVAAPSSSDDADPNALDTSAFARLLPLGPIVGAVIGCFILAGIVAYCYRHYIYARTLSSFALWTTWQFQQVDSERLASTRRRYALGASTSQRRPV